MTPWVGLLKPVSHVDDPHQHQWKHLFLTLYSTGNIEIQEEKSRLMWPICPIKSLFPKENISKASKVVKQKDWQRQQNIYAFLISASLNEFMSLQVLEVNSIIIHCIDNVKWVFLAEFFPILAWKHQYKKFHSIPVSSVWALATVWDSKMDIIESLFL